MGRVKAFDEDQVLDKAMRLFWQKGFEATSVQDLVDAMGINRASLYDTFGDKQALYRRALGRFEARETGSAASLANGSLPLRDRVRAFLSVHPVGPSLGCMITNAALERAYADCEVRATYGRTIEGVAQALEHILKQAQERGELAPEKDCQALACALVMVSQGLRAHTRALPDSNGIGVAAIEGALALLD